MVRWRVGRNGAWTIQNSVVFVMQGADLLLDLPGCSATSSTAAGTAAPGLYHRDCPTRPGRARGVLARRALRILRELVVARHTVTWKAPLGTRG